MKFRLFPDRAVEATPAQIALSGAAPYLQADDDIGRGYRMLGGTGARGMPQQTLERLRVHSVASYRTNPMARAIIDTYTAFCVGDSGLTLNCTNRTVEAVAREFWDDPRTGIATKQDLYLTDHLLMGESVWEMMVVESSGRVRFSVIDPNRVFDVLLQAGNPLWPEFLSIRGPNGIDGAITKRVVALDDLSNLRSGEVQWWPSFQALTTDKRGAPFMAPIIDWLDSYDQVLSNLIDRTALARWIAMSVTIDGADDTAIKDWIARRSTSMPSSGSIEVHNEKEKWEPLTAQVGSYEDANTATNVLTSVAAGTGLSKHWLAEPEGVNRATSHTMAEPVRRRVNRVQNTWVGYQQEFTRYAVDRAVAAGRLPTKVAIEGPSGKQMVAPSMTVHVTGPEIAAADAQITATVLMQLAQGITELVAAEVMTPDAARFAVKKAWEDYMGIPYLPELDNVSGDDPAGKVDDVAQHIDDTQNKLRSVK